MISFIKKHKEIIFYIIFGAGTTLINWIVYTLCVTVFNADITLSNTVAWLAAILFAFITNKLFVFESREWKFKQTVKEALSFLGSRILSGFIEIGCPVLLVYLGINQSFFGIDGGIAKLITNIIVIVLNYILSKLFVFKK